VCLKRACLIRLQERPHKQSSNWWKTNLPYLMHRTWIGSGDWPLDQGWIFGRGQEGQREWQGAFAASGCARAGRSAWVPRGHQSQWRPARLASTVHRKLKVSCSPPPLVDPLGSASASGNPLLRRHRSDQI